MYLTCESDIGKPNNGDWGVKYDDRTDKSGDRAVATANTG